MDITLEASNVPWNVQWSKYKSGEIGMQPEQGATGLPPLPIGGAASGPYGFAELASKIFQRAKCSPPFLARCLIRKHQKN
jgi:hypothetical protein